MIYANTMRTRKENRFIKDDEQRICRITTSLTKKINKEINIWKADIGDIEPYEYECIIDYDEKLIELIRENYLVFYDNANDVRRSSRKSPEPIPYPHTGYFWCWNIHDKGRIPLARLVWCYKFKQEIPNGFVIDHGNDMKFINTLSNLSLLTQQQNITKLRYPKRVIEPYSVTMISHPLGWPIKLIRFKDDINKIQELLVYNVENNVQIFLDDLNIFKYIVDISPEKFKRCYENLKMTSKSYLACVKQATTGDKFTDEIFSYSIDWQMIDDLITIERFTTLAG